MDRFHQKVKYLKWRLIARIKIMRDIYKSAKALTKKAKEAQLILDTDPTNPQVQQLAKETRLLANNACSGRKLRVT